MSGIYNIGALQDDFVCCSNSEVYPFKCVNCGHIMAYCVESSDLFPDIKDLSKTADVVNALNPNEPAFRCPQCQYTFEYYFLKNPKYAVNREEIINLGLEYLLMPPH